MKRIKLSEESLIKRMSYGRVIIISEKQIRSLYSGISDSFSRYPYCEKSQNICKCLAGCGCLPTYTACNICQASWE